MSRKAGRFIDKDTPLRFVSVVFFSIIRYNFWITKIKNMDSSSVGQLLRQKKEAKKNMGKMFSFSSKKPLLGIFLDKELPQESEKKVSMFLQAVKVLDIEVALLADSNLASLSLPNVIYIPYSRLNRKSLLEAADMALTFEFTDVEEMLLNGVIPISPNRPEVKDYNPNIESGNGFIYKQEDPWCIFAALVRARETFKFPYDWKHIVRQGITAVTKA